MEHRKIDLIERQIAVLTLADVLHYICYAERRGHRQAIVVQLVAALALMAAIAAAPPSASLNPMAMRDCALGMALAFIGTLYGPHSSLRLGGRVIFLLFLAQGLGLVALSSPQQLTWSLTIFAVMVVAMSPLLIDPLSFIATAGLICHELALRHRDAISASPEALWMGVLIVFSLVFGAMLNFFYFSERTRAYLFSRKLAELAYIDSLTRIDNRRAFLEDLERACVAAETAGRFCFLLLDIDDFKAINDRYGHAKGDLVLQHVARHIKHLTAGHSCGRLGGEEFGILFHGDTREAMAFASRINTLLASSECSGLKVTASLGVAMHRPGLSMERLMLQADQALYRAKAAGKNQAVLATTKENLQ